MKSETPTVIDYAPGPGQTREGQSSRMRFVLGAFILSGLFFYSANFVENRTSDYLVGLGNSTIRPVFGWNSRLPSGRHQDTDLMVELIWSVPATALFATGLIVFPARRQVGVGWQSLFAAVIGAVAYSWVRWTMDLTGHRVGDGADFLIAMLLAILAGLVVGKIRDSACRKSRRAVEAVRDDEAG